MTITNTTGIHSPLAAVDVAWRRSGMDIEWLSIGEPLGVADVTVFGTPAEVEALLLRALAVVRAAADSAEAVPA